MPYKTLIATLIFVLCASLAFSTSPVLKLNYTFNQQDENPNIIQDETGNGYNATLQSGATIKTIGKYNFFETGSNNGFLDLGSKVGEVIDSLNDFTISTYLYISPSANLSGNGNFIWTFSNSSDILNHPEGCMFFSAKDTRYAISLTYWTGEQTVGLNSQCTKGKWVHYTYTQKGNIATVYIDGIDKVARSNLNIYPSALGATSYNYLGRSPYMSDDYLKSAMYYDFRIYDQALSADSIASLASQRELLDTLTYTDLVKTAVGEFQLENVNQVTQDIQLPQSLAENISVSWQSSDTSIISNTGVVHRPVYNSDTASVTMTATITCNFISKNKAFTLKVVPFPSDSACVETDLGNLQISGNLDHLRDDLVLPLKGNEGSTISWSSDQPTYLNDNGKILNRLPKGQGKLEINLTATVSKGDVSETKTFKIYLAEDDGFSGYLFAYFTGNSGNQEAIRFALSDDGLNYKALNNNNPVLNTSDISETGGVRDPNILRGEDGNFYMVATDMVSAWGWNSNRGIVLLKSSDLIHWTSATINVPKNYPSLFGNVIRVWAPETIYDPEAGKYMIYFSMLKGDGDYDKIYYAYANSSFTGFESAPKLLFDHNGHAAIDANIVLKDGTYNLFYKTEGSGNGIQKATAESVTGPYTAIDKYLQPNSNAVEGECVFRLINSNTWYMIYDVYTSGYYEFSQSTDLDNFTVVDGVSFDFRPRHGTIIPITEKEITRLKTNQIVYSGLTTNIKQLENPATDTISAQKVISTNGFHIKSKKKTKIDIYNLSGVKVKSFELRPGTNFIQIPSGIYIIEQSKL